MRLRTVIAIATFVLGATAVSMAAGPPTFEGPKGDWKHTDPAGTDTRHVESWKLFTDQSLTVVTDTTVTYSDALAPIQKNIADNHIKTSVDKDETCLGKPAHVVEFSFGTEGHQTIINRTIASDGTGSVQITYARAGDDQFDPDVRKAIDAFCAQPG